MSEPICSCGWHELDGRYYLRELDAMCDFIEFHRGLRVAIPSELIRRDPSKVLHWTVEMTSKGPRAALDG